MGKHSNAQGLRLVKNKNWVSKFYTDSFNYSNILGQDLLIRDFVLNFLLKFKVQVSAVSIKRSGHFVLVDLETYNDSWTFTESFMSRYVSKLNSLEATGEGRSVVSKDDVRFLISSDENSGVFFNFGRTSSLSKANCPGDNFRGYSLRRLLSLNLSYLLKSPVRVRNKNIVNTSPALLDLFWSLTSKYYSPLPKHLSFKFSYLVYHSLQYKSALLLCRYLSVLLPRFCTKNRKNRKINPFISSLRKLIKLLFSNGFCDKRDIKGVKVLLKGRLNGARRKSKQLICYGRTSVCSLEDSVSYHQEHCYTLFGVSGIKVWIIS